MSHWGVLLALVPLPPIPPSASQDGRGVTVKRTACLTVIGQSSVLVSSSAAKIEERDFHTSCSPRSSSCWTTTYDNDDGDSSGSRQQQRTRTETTRQRRPDACYATITGALCRQAQPSWAAQPSHLIQAALRTQAGQWRLGCTCQTTESIEKKRAVRGGRSRLHTHSESLRRGAVA